MSYKKENWDKWYLNIQSDIIKNVKDNLKKNPRLSVAK